MFLKSKLVFSKGTCISLDFDFNPRLRENILTLFIFNIIIQNRGLFHICISYLNSSQIPYHGSFVDMTNKNSSGSLNVIGDEENDGWGYFIIVANSRALVLLGESNSKSYSFGTRTTRLPKIPSTIFLWNEDNQTSTRRGVGSYVKFVDKILDLSVDLFIFQNGYYVNRCVR